MPTCWKARPGPSRRPGRARPDGCRRRSPPICGTSPGYPADQLRRVVLIIDNAPWHPGRPIDEALAESPHLEFSWLPSYNPHLNGIERFWRVLRRQATHNRLFDRLADLKRSVRDSLCSFQAVRSLVAKSYSRPRKPESISGFVKEQAHHRHGLGDGNPLRVGLWCAVGLGTVRDW